MPLISLPCKLSLSSTRRHSIFVSKRAPRSARPTEKTVVKRTRDPSPLYKKATAAARFLTFQFLERSLAVFLSLLPPSSQKYGTVAFWKGISFFLRACNKFPSRNRSKKRYIAVRAIWPSQVSQKIIKVWPALIDLSVPRGEKEL